ncbi:MAG: crossover junction endodeoxyribonuclease RuvC, partial [Bacteroidales bacterium]|nr:crossover junction endodeoxyribonuclease RuvC [Bacteroidales bacterium]
MSNKNSQRILGIDPGTNILGFSVIEIQGKSIKLIEMSVLKLGKIDDMSKRMKVLFDTISNIIDKYQPE